jgi:hypothetical protein
MRAILIVLLLLSTAPVWAETIVTDPKKDAIKLTVTFPKGWETERTQGPEGAIYGAYNFKNPAVSSVVYLRIADVQQPSNGNEAKIFSTYGTDLNLLAEAITLPESGAFDFSIINTSIKKANNREYANFVTEYYTKDYVRMNTAVYYFAYHNNIFEIVVKCLLAGDPSTKNEIIAAFDKYMSSTCAPVFKSVKALE